MPQLDLGKVVGDTGHQGPKGDTGTQGPAGPAGPGVAVGGSANQVLVKHSGTNYDTQWVDAGNLPAFAGVRDAVAIVADGDTHPAIADGQFVYVRNHSTLAEGLYKATAAIGTDVALTTSNLTADGSGGLNDLKGQIDSLNSNLENKVENYKYSTAAEIPTAEELKTALESYSGARTFVITFLSRGNNNQPRSAMIYAAASSSYGAGLLFSYYGSSWYKVKNTNTNVTMTAF